MSNVKSIYTFYKVKNHAKYWQINFLKILIKRREYPGGGDLN